MKICNAKKQKHCIIAILIGFLIYGAILYFNLDKVLIPIMSFSLLGYLFLNKTKKKNKDKE